jgi:hypothetical protein
LVYNQEFFPGFYVVKPENQQDLKKICFLPGNATGIARLSGPGFLPHFSTGYPGELVQDTGYRSLEPAGDPGIMPDRLAGIRGPASGRSPVLLRPGFDGGLKTGRKLSGTFFTAFCRFFRLAFSRTMDLYGKRVKWQISEKDLVLSRMAAVNCPVIQSGFFHSFHDRNNPVVPDTGYRSIEPAGDPGIMQGLLAGIRRCFRLTLFSGHALDVAAFPKNLRNYCVFLTVLPGFPLTFSGPWY